MCHLFFTVLFSNKYSGMVITGDSTMTSILISKWFLFEVKYIKRFANKSNVDITLKRLNLKFVICCIFGNQI